MKRLANFIMGEFFSIFNPVFFGLLTLSLAIRFAKIYETGGFNLPISQTLQTILLVIPSVTAVIMPVAFLISISVTTTKLCSTTELTALQASGVSAVKVFKVYLSVTLIMFLFYLAITVFVKPTTNLHLMKLLSSISTGSVKISPIEKNFSRISENLYLYCDKSDKTMEKVILFHQESEENTTIIFSKRASTSLEKPSAFVFEDGELMKIEKGDGSYMNFKTLSYNPFSERSANEKPSAKGTISTFRLWEKIKASKATNPEKTEFINRLITPLSLLIFLLLSFPFSLSQARNYKTSGITISLIVGLFYFILTSFISTFSLKGFVNPLLSIPSTNIFLLALSLIIFYKKVWNRA